MAQKKDRKYKVEMAMTGNPPKVEPVLKHSGKIVFNKTADKMKKVDHYRIRFELDNPNQTNLRFVRNADAMWVHGDVTVCPTSFCEMPGVIWVDEIDPAGEWIDVINMDLVVQDFRFTLNFADDSISNPTPADYVPLDPIGGNENGGRTGSRFEIGTFTAVALGAAVGLVAFTAAETFLRAW